MKLRWLTAVLATLGPLGVATCRTQTPAAGDSASATSLHVPALSGTTAAAGARGAVSGRSTPGKILCGATACDLQTEVCCTDFIGDGQRCAARPEDPGASPCGENALTKYCDGAEDCPGGACCDTAACTGGCPPLHACESPRCESEPGGVCVPGGVCPEGFECLTAKGSLQGSCVFQDPGVDCGATRCSGATPLCCWNVKTKNGKCSDACPGEGVGDVARLSCANNADCAGYVCGRFSSSPAQSYSCAGHSFAGDRFDPILCASVADCPKHFGAAPTSCSPPGDGSLPPNAKICGYE